MSTLHWGIACAGLISHDFVTALATLPRSDHEVVAVAGKDLERTHQFAAKHNIKKAYEGFELLAEDDKINIVYVGVRNPDHFDVVKLMLSRGKHVLCEKPLCMNYEQAKELIDYAKKKRLLLLEGVWSRFFPVYEALDKHIQSGGLGDVHQVNIEFGVPIIEDERRLMKENGGGTVMDLGLYVIQLAQMIYKEEPLKIVCSGHIDKHGIDESMSCILTYSNGKTATLSTSMKVLLNNSAVIFGTDGCLKIQTFWAPTVLQTSTVNITEWQLPVGGHRFNFHNSGGLVYEAEECRKCIKEGLIESPKMTHADTLLLSKICEKLRQELGVLMTEN